MLGRINLVIVLIASFIWLLSPFTAPSLSAMPATSTDDLGLSTLVNGVQKVSSPGTPGPVFANSSAWIPIVAGDEDTSLPSTYVMARQFGSGRVMIAGHEGILTRPDILDNGRFLVNSASWLDSTASRRVQYTIGHSEWAAGSNLTALHAMLQAEGYTVNPLSGTIDATKLNSTSVLIIGNAWGAFSDAEILAVKTFVENGGGLFLFGLGWSWPGDYNDYPMTRMATPYEVRWLTVYITDPTDNLQGSPVFKTFYPNIKNGTVFDAMALIQQAHAQHPIDLAQTLEIDATLRANFVTAHRLLAIPTGIEFAPGDILRQSVFDFYAGLIPSWQSYYGRAQVFSSTSASTSAWVRERAWLSWRDAVDLTPDVRATISQQLQGRRQTIFSQFGIVLLDNSSLDDRQLEFIENFFAQLPVVQNPQLRAFHNMGSISVVDFLGHAQFNTDGFLRGRFGGVNIFSFRIGGLYENSFPSDISQGLVDVFSVAVAHETNHIVDAYYINGNSALAARKNDLIRQAGSINLNYLRSMFDPNFFQQNPQEFVASIANEWFTDSDKTLQLGLVRFAAGRPEPLNQALFFAELYSVGTNTTRFYRTDTAGRMESTNQNLRRNSSGQIDQLSIGGQTYRFVRDLSGNVLDVQIAASVLSLNYDGPIRDRVGQNDFARNPDGQLDGTFTVTLNSGSGNRTVTQIWLVNSAGGVWNTEGGDGVWTLGVANGWDTALINGSNDSVNFPVADGGKFRIFAAEFESRMFLTDTEFTLYVYFSDGSSAKGNVTITNAGLPFVTVTATTPTANEGGTGGAFTFTRTGSTASSLTVNYLVAGTAVAGTHYTALTGSALIAAGSTTGTIAVVPLENSLADGDKSVDVTLGNGAAYVVGSPSAATVIVHDNDVATGPPSITLRFDGSIRDRVGQNNLARNSDGQLDGTFTVTLNPGSGNRTVTQMWLENSAGGVWNTDGGDGFWTLGVASGWDTALLNSNNDAVSFPVADGGEFRIFASDFQNRMFLTGTAFTVNLYFSDGSSATGNVTIAQTVLPIVTVMATAPTANEGGASGAFTFTRTGSTASALTVNYSVAGTAVAGTHYTALTGSVLIAAGSTTATIAVVPLENSLADGDRTVDVTLSNSAAYVVGSPLAATVLVHDNDGAPTGPPSITLRFDGSIRDRVGQGNLARTPDGQPDGTFSVTLNGGSGNRTVTQVWLVNTAGGVWNTDGGDGFWTLGVADGWDSTLANGGNDAVNLLVADGSEFKIFGADYQNRMFPSGVEFTLVVTFADGSTATASHMIP